VRTVGRQPQPEIAERLLDACTDVALAHGLPDRLAPFAAATGTSQRMLLYHFGTRDGLLRAVLHRARERQRRLFGDALRRRDDEPYPVTLRRAWGEMTGERGRPFLAMFGRLREDTEQQLWPGFRRAATTDWLAALDEGLPGRGTLALAVVRGLILDLEATGDRARVDAAFDDFVRSL
jgi:AcrR family transcriptional regulator